MTVARLLAAVAALVTLAALALQLWLSIDKITAEGGTVLQGVWRYFGFFTMLINIAAAVITGAMALRPASHLADPRAQLAVATGLIIAGIVQVTLLRPTEHSTGGQLIADHALHELTPTLFVIAWLFGRRGRLRWYHAGWAAVPPLAYAGYGLVRGAFDGWYAYWFLDPATLTLAEFVRNAVMIVAGFVAVALVLVLVDKLRARLLAHAG